MPCSLLPGCQTEFFGLINFSPKLEPERIATFNSSRAVTTNETPPPSPANKSSASIFILERTTLHQNIWTDNLRVSQSIPKKALDSLMSTHKTALFLVFLCFGKPGQHQSKDLQLRTSGREQAHSQWVGPGTTRTGNVLPHKGEVNAKSRGSTQHLPGPRQGKHPNRSNCAFSNDVFTT